jgi:hypothetical protein
MCSSRCTARGHHSLWRFGVLQGSAAGACAARLFPQLRGIMNERGKPFSAASINSMLNA